jgi:hypothetical protein
MHKRFNICIVNPDRHLYAGVFFEIADLLMYSIRDLGYQVDRSFNNIDIRAINIIIAVHLLDIAYIKNIPANSIILNTEQLSVTLPEWNQRILQSIECGLEFWDYSDTNIQYIKNIEKFSNANIKKLNIGYQSELRNIVNHDYEIDVLFYGSINERREYILNSLKDRGLKVKVFAGIYGKDRDYWISRSKVVLNLHYYNAQIFEVVRVFHLLTNSIAVVAEVNNSTIIEQRFKDGILAAPYEQLVDYTVDLIGNENKLKEQRWIGYESIKKYPQSNFTSALLL